jgi:mono/diheme cytochrome c family protein
MRAFKLGLLFSAAALAAACATATNTSTPSNTAPITNSGGTAATTPAAGAATGDLASARSMYRAACVNCHKENGEGGVAELEEGARLNVPSFKTAHSIGHTDAQFARKIANGDKDEGMPAFKGRLTPEQINGLVRFIRAEFQSAGPKDGPGHK